MMTHIPVVVCGDEIRAGQSCSGLFERLDCCKEKDHGDKAGGEENGKRKGCVLYERRTLLTSGFRSAGFGLIVNLSDKA